MWQRASIQNIESSYNLTKKNKQTDKGMSKAIQVNSK